MKSQGQPEVVVVITELRASLGVVQYIELSKASTVSFTL